jgi:hypothetical protein
MNENDRNALLLSVRQLENFVQSGIDQDISQSRNTCTNAGIPNWGSSYGEATQSPKTKLTLVVSVLVKHL